MKELKNTVFNLPTTIYFIAIISLLSVSCKKDKTESIDITESKWKLKSITLDANTFKPTENKTRYILEFLNDSIFQLNLSFNKGGGKYQILTRGEIHINTFSPMTEICCENGFDYKLIETFSNSSTYKVLGSTLVFNGSKGDVIFKED